MSNRGRPRDDCPSSAAERMRRYRDRQRRGVSVLPPIEISEARQVELATLLGLTPEAPPEEIAAAIAKSPVAVARNESVD